MAIRPIFPPLNSATKKPVIIIVSPMEALMIKGIEETVL